MGVSKIKQFASA